MDINTVIPLCILVGAIALTIGFVWGRGLSLRHLCRSALLRCGLVQPTESEVFRRNFYARARQWESRPTITPEAEDLIPIDPKAWRE